MYTHKCTSIPTDVGRDQIRMFIALYKSWRNRYYPFITSTTHPFINIVSFVPIFKISHAYYIIKFLNRVISIQNYYTMITRSSVFVFNPLYRYSFSYTLLYTTLHSVRCPHIRPPPFSVTLTRVWVPTTC